MTWRFDNDLDWMRDAACVGMDGDLFFSEGGRIALSRLPCGICPVRAECLAVAVNSEIEIYGVWGGVTAGQLGRASSF